MVPIYKVQVFSNNIQNLILQLSLDMHTEKKAYLILTERIKSIRIKLCCILLTKLAYGFSLDILLDICPIGINW